MATTRDVFDAYLASMAFEDATKRAMLAAWWFIENVTEGDPDRTGVFFATRELVRATASTPDLALGVSDQPDPG